MHITIYEHIVCRHLRPLPNGATLRNGSENWGYRHLKFRLFPPHTHTSHSFAQLHSRNPSHLSIRTHAHDMHVQRHGQWVHILHWVCSTDLHWHLYSYSSHLSWTQHLSSTLLLLIWVSSRLGRPQFSPPSYFSLHLSLDLLPSLPQPLAILSLSSVLSPLLGIGGSISFKTHVKGTVCRFQRPLCPAFLPLNLVSPKTLSHSMAVSPPFLPATLSSRRPLPLILPTVLNTFYWRRYV